MDKKLFEVFALGVDYGQLLMEEERDNEDDFSGFLGSVHSSKYSTPMPQNKRRQPHSEEWRKAKRNSYKKFIKMQYEQ